MQDSVPTGAYSCRLLKPGATLTFNYPGYGSSEGLPSEKRILADALLVFDELTSREGIAPENVVPLR